MNRHRNSNKPLPLLALLLFAAVSLASWAALSKAPASAQRGDDDTAAVALRDDPVIDHALDCPTCDKSGECYLQDNTYLHNVYTNPYRRPKLAQPYEHFSATIDYKWDRCIMCNRCTRVCDEMIGVTAITIGSTAPWRRVRSPQVSGRMCRGSSSARRSGRPTAT